MAVISLEFTDNAFRILEQTERNEKAGKTVTLNGLSYLIKSVSAPQNCLCKQRLYLRGNCEQGDNLEVHLDNYAQKDMILKLVDLYNSI